MLTWSPRKERLIIDAIAEDVGVMLVARMGALDEGDFDGDADRAKMGGRCWHYYMGSLDFSSGPRKLEENLRIR